MVGTLTQLVPLWPPLSIPEPLQLSLEERRERGERGRGGWEGEREKEKGWAVCKSTTRRFPHLLWYHMFWMESLPADYMGGEVYVHIHWYHINTPYTTHGTVKPLIKDHLSNIKSVYTFFKVYFLQRRSLFKGNTQYIEPSALYSEGPFSKCHCSLSVCVCVCVCVCYATYSEYTISIEVCDSSNVL